jgi:hypothetical protein
MLVLGFAEGLAKTSLKLRHLPLIIWRVQPRENVDDWMWGASGVGSMRDGTSDRQHPVVAGK